DLESHTFCCRRLALGTAAVGYRTRISEGVWQRRARTLPGRERGDVLRMPLDTRSSRQHRSRYAVQRWADADAPIVEFRLADPDPENRWSARLHGRRRNAPAYTGCDSLGWEAAAIPDAAVPYEPAGRRRRHRVPENAVIQSSGSG